VCLSECLYLVHVDVCDAQRLFADQLDNICNQLKKYEPRLKSSNCTVPLHSAIAAVIGQPDEFGGTVGQRHKPATWDNPVLLAVSLDGTNYTIIHRFGNGCLCWL